MIHMKFPGTAIELLELYKLPDLGTGSAHRRDIPGTCEELNDVYPEFRYILA
jgi:hypothetical protein